ncbi:hypothetical protein ACFQJ8_13195 [Halocatena marina]|uniref:DUF7503 family protein n=1 Tax=Halocatena marina TaxID=2934937 RepID=UPI00360C12F3
MLHRTICNGRKHNANTVPAEHPRMIGVAAVMCFLLTQVGNAAAAGGGTIG